MWLNLDTSTELWNWDHYESRVVQLATFPPSECSYGNAIIYKGISRGGYEAALYNRLDAAEQRGVVCGYTTEPELVSEFCSTHLVNGPERVAERSRQAQDVADTMVISLRFGGQPIWGGDFNEPPRGYAPPTQVAPSSLNPIYAYSSPPQADGTPAQMGAGPMGEVEGDRIAPDVATIGGIQLDYIFLGPIYQPNLPNSNWAGNSDYSDHDVYHGVIVSDL